MGAVGSRLRHPPRFGNRGAASCSPLEGDCRLMPTRTSAGPSWPGFFFDLNLRHSTVAKSEQALGIAKADFFPRVRREIERFHHGDDLANEAAAAFRIERAVGGEQHVVGAEKIQAADD